MPTASSDAAVESAARQEPTKQPGLDVFVARQPIFDERKKIFGYELLFRSGLENSCPPTEGSEATRHVLHTAWIELGLSALVGQKLPFVNFNRDLLLSDVPDMLPADSLAIEVLEDVEPKPDVLAACQQLKRNGYMLALDDFIYRPDLEPLMALADIVKIRMGEADLEEQRDHVLRATSHAPKLLAEKVETKSDFDQALKLGFCYFQGWFFCRPEVVSTRTLKGSRLTYLRLIQAISQRELDLNEIEQIIRSDVSISHRFIKFVGSASFGFRAPISDVRRALVLLGERQVRRWVSLVALGALSDDKPQELLINSAVRARFCDELASEAHLPDRRADLFLVGAFSLLDTMLDTRMGDVLAQLPLEDELKGALEGQPNTLRPVLEYVEAYERADWEKCQKLGAELGLKENKVTQLYRTSVEWAMESLLG